MTKSKTIVGDAGSSEVRNETEDPKRDVQRKYWAFRCSLFSGNIWEADFKILGVDELKSILQKSGIETYVFQLECGEESDYLHYQGYAEAPGKKGWRFNQCRNVLECWWEPTSSKAYIDYCQKKDTRVDGPFHFPYKYMGEDLPTELNEWENKIIDIINGPVDPRKVYWFMDITGGKGKSTFCKYLKYHYNKRVTICGGEYKDVCFQLVNKEVVENPICIFDLEKGKGNRVSYAAIEACKNGMFSSSKYESCDYIGPRAHVIVFSNMEPDRTKLSNDRWVVINI